MNFTNVRLDISHRTSVNLTKTAESHFWCFHTIMIRFEIVLCGADRVCTYLTTLTLFAKKRRQSSRKQGWRLSCSIFLSTRAPVFHRFFFLIIACKVWRWKRFLTKQITFENSSQDRTKSLWRQFEQLNLLCLLYNVSYMSKAIINSLVALVGRT